MKWKPVPSQTEQTDDGVLHAARQVLAAFRHNWKRFLAIHIAVNLLSLVVLTPLVTLLMGWLILASGHTALTDEDILFFVLSPAGLLPVCNRVIIRIFTPDLRKGRPPP